MDVPARRAPCVLGARHVAVSKGVGARRSTKDSRFVLVVSKGCKQGHRPVSKECGKSQPLRALCLSFSRYRLNRPTHPPITQEARAHAASGVHQTPESSVAFHLAYSSSDVGLLSSAPSCLVLAAALAPPPPPLPPPKPPPHFPFLCRTLLRLGVPTKRSYQRTDTTVSVVCCLVSIDIWTTNSRLTKNDEIRDDHITS